MKDIFKWKVFLCFQTFHTVFHVHLVNQYSSNVMLRNVKCNVMLKKVFDIIKMKTVLFDYTLFCFFQEKFFRVKQNSSHSRISANVVFSGNKITHCRKLFFFW